MYRPARDCGIATTERYVGRQFLLCGGKQLLKSC